MTHRLEILDVQSITHDVRRIKLEKPQGYSFTPGQATDVSVDKDGWRDEQRPFTFTALNDWDHLEFTIKIYPSHDGTTDQIGALEKGDHLLLEEPWGAIQYKGPGVFIAGGAGVTPFIAILRQLEVDGNLSGNTLIFSNKAERDIMLRPQFEAMDGLETVFTLTEQRQPEREYGRIDEAMLKRYVSTFDQHFYVCGPDAMVDAMKSTLDGLGAQTDSLVFEG